MAQFISFDKNAEVAGHAILSCLSCFPEYYRADVEDLLKQKNIVDVAPDKWFSLQNYLDILKVISTRYGSNTLFNVGLAIGDSHPFPPETTLEAVLRDWEAGYYSHHRALHQNGYFGHVKLKSFDYQAKKAVVEFKSPYPYSIVHGVAMALARKYKSKDAGFIDVQLDKNLTDVDSCFYVFTWI